MAKNKKLKTQKNRKTRKKRYTIKELDAIEELYGSHFTKATLARNFLTYSIATIAFSYVLYASIPIVIIYVILSCLYVYYKIIPNNIRMNYEMKAHAERNRSINIITQSLSSGHTSIKNAISMAIKNSNGEFRKDLKLLYAKILSDTTFEAIHEAFTTLKNKYPDDIYFGLFLEQLEVGLNKSHPDLRTLIIVRKSHNYEYNRIKAFRLAKRQAMHDMVKMLGLTFVVCCTVAYMFGYQKFLTMYAHNLIGMAISTLFMFVLFMIINKFMNMYQDTAINSI